MKNILYIIIPIIVSFLYFSCNTEHTTSKNTIDTSGRKFTQALLLTQPFAFDPADANKISGDYIAKNKLTIPQNLPIQHKWIMFEGPVLENDFVAYRFYGDSRHRIDIFGKRVSDLVMDTVSWKYHDIMDWGSDILKVGNTLGIGSPAIWYNDSLYTLSDCEEKTIEILESKNNKSTIRTTFKNLSIEDKNIDLVQDWSIEAGQPWSEIHLQVVNGQLPDDMNFATGIAKHLPDISEGITSNYFYAMNWGKQSFHEENLGMAVLADQMYKPVAIVDQRNHAYAFKNAKQEVRYRFLAAWERDVNKIKDVEGFTKIVIQSGR